MRTNGVTVIGSFERGAGSWQGLGLLLAPGSCPLPICCNILSGLTDLAVFGPFLFSPQPTKRTMRTTNEEENLWRFIRYHPDPNAFTVLFPVGNGNFKLIGRFTSLDDAVAGRNKVLRRRRRDRRRAQHRSKKAINDTHQS
jgi:hypothetical protein